jgi:hypothetical protein
VKGFSHGHLKMMKNIGLILSMYLVLNQKCDVVWQGMLVTLNSWGWQQNGILLL